MDRRSYLAAFGTASSLALTGCGGSSNTGSPAAAKTRKKQNSDSYYDIGGSFTTDSDVSITVDRVRLANSVTFQEAGEIEPGEGKMFVLAHLTAKNTADETQPLPFQSNVALVSGSDQYDSLRDSSYTAGSQLSAPVEGKLYEGLQDARPQVARKGWLIYIVPRDTTQVTVSWSNSEVEAYWQTKIDASTLPNIKLQSIKAPDSTRIGESVEVTLNIKNSGGSTGTVSTTITVATPGSQVKERDFTTDVPAGEVVTETLEFQPIYLGNIAVSIKEPQGSVQIPVKPAIRSVGQSFRQPKGPRVTVDELALADSFTHESYNGTETVEASSGHKFAVIRYQVSNPTDETQPVPGENTVTIYNGETNIERTRPGVLPDQKIISPLSGLPFFVSLYNLDPGQSKTGLLLFEVNEDRARDDLQVWVDWGIGAKIEVHWKTSM